MKRLSKSLLKYSDENYSKAVNYSQSLYNYPITLNIGAKDSRLKYILGCGTSDSIDMFIDGIFVYVLSQNNGLGYISLAVINTETKEIEDIHLSGDDCDHKESYSFGILDMDSKEQINILLEYLN